MEQLPDKNTCQLFIALLRAAMSGEKFESVPSAEEWSDIYNIACQQSVLGVCYTAISRLSKQQQPPMNLMLQWMGEAETIRTMNELLNKEAARLTQLFLEQGRKTAILKGQANARLYPDRFSRQVGDIDIWVEGGRESVIALLKEMQMVNEIVKRKIRGKAKESYHHIHIPINQQGVIVEVHFRPSSGNYNPITNRRLQQWLEREILNTTIVEQGFNEPSIKFSMIMQLAHIQHHFLKDGMGLRHLNDYYLLLQNSTAEDRQEVAAKLKPFGLQHIAGAMMWVLGEVFLLDKGLMLCEPDRRRGEWMLREIMKDGNFGYNKRKNKSFSQRRMSMLTRSLRMLRFDFREMTWRNLRFWSYLILSIPERIRKGTLFFGKSR